MKEIIGSLYLKDNYQMIIVQLGTNQKGVMEGKPNLRPPHHSAILDF